MAARTEKSRASKAPSKPDPSGDAPVYLVVGDEYLVSAHARELVDRLCPPEEQALSLEIVDARAENVADAVAALDQGVQGLRTMGFFGGRKTVWLCEATFLANKKVAGSEAAKASVARLVGDIKDGLPDGVRLVISAPGLDKRSALYKACDAQGAVTSFAAPDKPWLAEKQARERAPDLLAEEGLRANRAAIDALIQKTGPDTRQIAQEARKLAVYLGDRTEVTVEDVQEIVSVSREAIAWDFADAVGTHNLPLALSILRQMLFQGQNEIGILFALEQRFRELILIKECLNKSWCTLQTRGNYVRMQWSEGPAIDEALGQLNPDPRKMHEFRAARLAEQAKQFSRRELIEAQRLVIDTHEHLISQSLRKDLQLEFLVLKLLGGASSSADASPRTKPASLLTPPASRSRISLPGPG